MKKAITIIGRILSYGLSFVVSVVVIGLMWTTEWGTTLLEWGPISCGLFDAGAGLIIIWSLLIGVICFGVEKLWKRVLKG